MYEDKGYSAKMLETLLCTASGEAFYNTSQYLLKDLRSFNSPKTLEQAFTAYRRGFSKNMQLILEKFKFDQTAEFLIEKNLLGGVLEKNNRPPNQPWALPYS